MLTRVLLRLFLLSGLAAPLCAFALGVGQLEVRSALNQVFEAELPLIINNPAELTGLSVRIPRQEDFDRLGIERLELLSKLRFSVQAPPGGRSVVQISSIEPIREPNFNLLLELVWPRGRLIREFTVQLDPELYANRRLPPPPPPIVAPPLPTVAPPVAAAPTGSQLPPPPPVSFEGASLYGPVRTGETLMAIANRVRPSTAISLPQMMAILVAGNPTAFVNGNPNALRAGATLRVPTPQALGLTASPALAAAPAPADLTTPVPPTVSTPEPASPPLTTEPGALPAAAATPPLPVTPPVVVVPPAEPAPAEEAGSVSLAPLPAEPLREIVPQAAVPQTEPPPVAAAPETAASPPVAAAPETTAPPPEAAPPVAAAPPPVAATPPPAPAESELSWMSNPVVWIALALIVLAVAAVILLPLLRRPARPKPMAVAEAPAQEPEEAPAAGESPGVVTTQTQVREPSRRPRPAVGVAAAAPAVSTSLEAGSSPPSPAAAPTTPRPLKELLEDFDFGLGGGALPPASIGLQGAAPEPALKAPLLEIEPPTAPVTRRSAESLADTAAKAAEQGKEPPAQPPSTELPPELRLEGLNFDFGDIELGQAARSQPSELPPLEMKPVALGTGKPFAMPSLQLKIAEPATEPPSVAPPPAPADSGKDLKFEFTDVTQELARYDTQQESLKLDEALQNLGGDTLKRGAQVRDVGAATLGGMDATDYVETKLDLAAAYLDMGDQVGARSLLEEVLQEGNTTQKERAEELLKKLG